MGYANDISNIPHLELDDQKDLLLYAMKIIPTDYKFLNDYQQTHSSSKHHSKRKNRSKLGLEKRRGKKSKKTHKKSKKKKKKHKKYRKNNKDLDDYLSNKGPRKAPSSSFLPIVVLNSNTKKDKDNHVSKSDGYKEKYWKKRGRHRPEMYDRDYYDEYFYEYPPPYSSSWYRYRKTIPRFRPRHGYNIESSGSEDHYTPLSLGGEEKQRRNIR